MNNYPQPKAEANKLVKIWRTFFPGEYPINVKKLILEYINLQNPNEKIGIFSEPLPFDGMLAKVTDGWGIFYNNKIKELGRQNFTIAHELGHYLCHRKLQDKFECGDKEFFDFGGKDSQKIEQEANEFAAVLLMPFDKIREELDIKPSAIEDIAKCAELLGSSLSATTFQWIKCAIQPVAYLKVDEDGFITRWSASAAAVKKGLFFGYGLEIPALSLTAKCIKDGNNPDYKKGLEISSDVWGRKVIESTFYSNKYKWGFTILNVID